MKPLKVAARMGLALCASFNLASLPAPAQAATPHAPVTRTAVKKPAKKPAPAMTLRFYNLHTDESMTLTRRKGQMLSAQATWFMRDYRQRQTINMDPKLFDLLGRLQGAVVQRHPNLSVQFQVVSSYRTPETNAGLRAAGGTQAVHSQHMLGKAMDIRVPGLSTRELRDIATCLKGGGVGYYEQDRFVHVDVGRVRYWPSHDYLATLNCNTQPRRTVAAR